MKLLQSIGIIILCCILVPAPVSADWKNQGADLKIAGKNVVVRQAHD